MNIFLRYLVLSQIMKDLIHPGQDLFLTGSLTRLWILLGLASNNTQVLFLHLDLKPGIIQSTWQNKVTCSETLMNLISLS